MSEFGRWIARLAWNIIYPPAIFQHYRDETRPGWGGARKVCVLHQKRKCWSCDASEAFAVAVVGLAGFAGVLVGIGQKAVNEYTLPFIIWVSAAFAIHIGRNAKPLLEWGGSVLWHVIYPPSLADATAEDGSRRCAQHRRRDCWVCAFEIVLSGMLILALNLGAVIVIRQYGIGAQETWPFLAWYGIVAVGLLWRFRKLVVDVLAWHFVRACRIVYPPLMIPLRDAKEPCECHGREGCGVCGLATFIDVMGTVSVFLMGGFMLTTYGVGVQAVPFIIWAAAALVLPVAVRVYRWADDVAQRQAMLAAPPASEPAVEAVQLRADVPPVMEMAEPLPVQLPCQELLDAITATPIEEATSEKLVELAGQVTAFEQEQNGGRPVQPLRDALAALEQMASTAQAQE